MRENKIILKKEMEYYWEYCEKYSDEYEDDYDNRYFDFWDFKINDHNIYDAIIFKCGYLKIKYKDKTHITENLKYLQRIKYELYQFNPILVGNFILKLTAIEASHKKIPRSIFDHNYFSVDLIEEQSHLDKNIYYQFAQINLQLDFRFDVLHFKKIFNF